MERLRWPIKRVLAALLCLAAASPAWAPVSSRLNIAEEDGGPSTFPWKLKVTNGSLTDNGDGTASLATSGGGGGGSLAGGSTSYIQNTSTLQSGSTFYVSSGTLGYFNLDIPGSTYPQTFDAGNALLSVVDAGNIHQVRFTHMSSGQIPIGRTVGGGFNLQTISGTTNQINVDNGNGSITLSLPNNVSIPSLTVSSSATLNGSLVISSNVVLNGSQGTSGQLFTSGAGGVPTWTTLQISSKTSGYQMEIPSGTVNGSNVTFTVQYIPIFIVSDGATYFEGQGYLRNGGTITFTAPPAVYIHSFHLNQPASATVDPRAAYLTYLTAQGFTPNRAVLFTEGTGAPVEHYTSSPVTNVGTPGWTTYLNNTAGLADDTGDNWGLGDSSLFLATSSQTILMVRRKTDSTLRASCGFGISFVAPHAYCQAHMPDSDGIVYWRFRDIADELTWNGYTPTTNIEAWAFRAGPAGLSIWKDGVKVSSSPTPVSRVSTSGSFFINSATFGGPDLVDVFFFAAIPDEISDAVLATFTPSNVLTGTGTPVNVTVPQSPAKGTLVTGLASGNYSTLAPGANGAVLISSSTSSNGVAWGSVSGTGGVGVSTGCSTLLFSQGFTNQTESLSVFLSSVSSSGFYRLTNILYETVDEISNNQNLSGYVRWTNAYGFSDQPTGANVGGVGATVGSTMLIYAVAGSSISFHIDLSPPFTEGRYGTNVTLEQINNVAGCGISTVSALSVYRDDVQITSGTGILKFSAADFDAAFQAGSTAYITINPNSPALFRSGKNNLADQYSVPYYSATGSSNTLSGSSNFQWNGATATVNGLVGINTSGAQDPSAAFQVDSTSKGLLPPRMTTAQRNAIVSPANGLTISNSDKSNQLETYHSGTWNRQIDSQEFRVGDADGVAQQALMFTSGGTGNLRLAAQQPGSVVSIYSNMGGGMSVGDNGAGSTVVTIDGPLNASSASITGLVSASTVTASSASIADINFVKGSNGACGHFSGGDATLGTASGSCEGSLTLYSNFNPGQLTLLSPDTGLSMQGGQVVQFPNGSQQSRAADLFSTSTQVFTGGNTFISSTTLSIFTASSGTVSGQLSAGSIKFPNGTIQVSSPPVVDTSGLLTTSSATATYAMILGSTNYWNYPSTGTFNAGKGISVSTLTATSTSTLQYVTMSTFTAASGTIAGNLSMTNSPTIMTLSPSSDNGLTINGGYVQQATNGAWKLTGTASGATYAFKNDDTTGMGSANNSKTVRFYANNVETVRISSSGYVGISTGAPQAALDVNGSVIVRSAGTAASPAVSVGVGTGIYAAFPTQLGLAANGSRGVLIDGNANLNVDWALIMSDLQCIHWLSDSYICRKKANTLQIGQSESIVSDLVVTGKVGISTGTPQNTLDVNGKSLFRSSMTVLGEVVVAPTAALAKLVTSTDTTNGQTNFIAQNNAAAGARLYLGTNRDPTTGVYTKTGQGAAQIELISADGGGQFAVKSSTVNNASLNTIATFDPNGETFNYPLIFSPTTNGIKGTTTNDNTTAGNVGEYVESVVSGDTNYGTASQYSDGTSISLTAGDWDVTALCYANSGTTALVTLVGVGISVTSGNSSTGLVTGSNFVFGDVTSTFRVDQVIPAYRMSLSGTTTVYMKIYAAYSGTTPTFRGRLSARRMR